MTRRSLTAAYGALLTGFVTVTLGREPFDDAYFFKRVALNLLEHGSLSWNPSDGPVYGITSQLFLALSVALTALAQNYTLLVTRLVLAACLAGAFWLTLSCTHELDRGLGAALAFCSPVALFTITSGMETAFALLLVSLGLRGRAHWLFAPLVALALWLTRPDAILLLLVPLVVARPRLRQVLVLGGGIALSLAAFKLYYGTALPLPFYAKQVLLSGYDADFIARSAVERRLHLGLFALSALPLAASALLRRDRTNLALLGGALGFVLYHALSTIDVMGTHARFYAPALPVLALAAARAGELTQPLRARLWLAAGVTCSLAAPCAVGWVESVPLPYYLAGGLGGALVLSGARRFGALLLLAGSGLAVAASHGRPRLTLPSDETFLRGHQRHVTVFRGLETLRACFGDALHVYHSEVGVPGLRFERGRVVDLAGLFDPTFLRAQQSFDARCRADAPDAIFLPHRNYVELNRAIAASSCLLGYDRVVADSSSPLYVRRDLSPRYQRCAAP